jgi:AsmA-like C-terminal region
LYSGGVLLLLLTIALGTGYLMKDKIIGRFIEEANKQLATPVKIGSMNISLISQFPNISIEFKDVYVEDSHPDVFALFTAKNVSFSFNAFDAWQGRYRIRGLNVVESETNIRINKKGIGNFNIIKAKDSTKKKQGVLLDLKNIRLKKQRVTYLDESVNQSHEFNSSSLAANVSVKNNVYNIEASGDAISNQVSIGRYVFLKGKLFNFRLSMVYDDVKKEVLFNPSSIDQERGEFELSGLYTFIERPTLDLKLDGKNTTLQTILSFLPESIAGAVEKYKSEGNLYFNLSVVGPLPNPLINVAFGFKDATIYHPETNFRITQANLTGTFSSPGFSRMSKAILSLKDVNGKLNGESFSGNFKMENFERPFVDFQFKGKVNPVAVNGIVGEEIFINSSGALLADVSLVGQPELLKNRRTAQQVKISGSLEMNDVSIATRLKGVDFQGVSGNFHFDRNDLAMSNVTGRLGNSDFALNGFFKNIVSYLLFEGQPIGIETDLKSDKIDLDQLLHLWFGQDASAEYKFQIPSNLHFNFNCRVGKLKYLKFRANDLEGNLLLKNQTAFSKGIKMRTMGGNISLSGAMSAIDKMPIELTATAKLNSIHLDSLFYIFGNFRQDFIQDKHLKGKATANVALDTKFTSELKIVPESLVASIDLTIKNGELNSFPPLQSLNKYLDDDGLRNLRFADLKNEIHIENQTVLIPMMEVRSNVTTIQLSGRHTFDQHIDYRIVAPLRNPKNINLAEAGTAYEDLAGKIKVYFKITGTTDNYKVAYDTDAVKKKIAIELKKEFAELKDAFNDKGSRKKKELELAKDDYFDWEN